MLKTVLFLVSIDQIYRSGTSIYNPPPPPQFYRFYNQKRTFLTPEFFFSKLRTLEKNTTKSHTHTQYVSYSLYGCYKLVYEIYGSITYGIQLFRNYKFWFISFCYAYFEILTINVNIEETI